MMRRDLAGAGVWNARYPAPIQEAAGGGRRGLLGNASATLSSCWVTEAAVDGLSVWRLSACTAQAVTQPWTGAQRRRVTCLALIRHADGESMVWQLTGD